MTTNNETSLYKGVIIEESLSQKDALKNIHIISSEVTEHPSWHIHTVEVFEDDIQKLSKNLKTGTWYMHFWKNDVVIAVFKDKIFKFLYSDKTTWNEAIEYGLLHGIPAEQLDFPINNQIKTANV